MGDRHDALGRVLRDLGDLEGARAELGQALAFFEAAMGPDHPEVATARGKLGGVLRDLGDLPAARAELERALVIVEASLGPDHPTVVVLRGDLQRVLRELEGSVDSGA
jgi:hypothetical protein